MPPDIGRIVLLIGVVLVVVGGLSVLGVRLPIGRLPGDIAIEGKNGAFYFPLTTMILASVILTLLWNLLSRR
jgi:Protein of unknown function (DUF2905)